MKRIAAGGVALLVLGVAAVVLYLTVIRDDAPEEFGLTDASETSDADQTETSADDAENAGDSGDSGDSDDQTTTESVEAGTTDGEAPAGDGSIDGSWTVAAGSEAGYRVLEDLRGITDFEAVGRTDQVTGAVEIEGTMVTAASFDVDVASIISDDGRRDTEFRGFAVMNAPEFPVANLSITEPIDFGGVPEPGSPISTTATGELTLRGATNPVTFPVEAQRLGDQIEVVASVDVLFSDYEIANPSNPFVSVRDEGKVEVRLLLSRS